jgi:hypothetical protein
MTAFPARKNGDLNIATTAGLRPRIASDAILPLIREQYENPKPRQ